MSDLFADPAYFLSATNPIANADQRDLEALAIRVLAMPAVQKSKQLMAQRWRTVAGHDMTAEAEARFNELVDEFAFNYVLKAVNSDPNYPKVLGHLYGPPHEWFGMKVPGSRASGGDGPDQNYTIVPIDGRAHYELHGRRNDPNIGDVPFTLTGNLSLSMTLDSLAWRDVKVDPDGRFVITLGPEPAAGRSNYIQTNLDARWLFIRDCRADWRQAVNSYRIKRLDPPTAAPLTADQLASRAGRFMIDDVPALYWFMRALMALEPNTVTAPFGAGSIGGLVQQQIAFLHLKLASDEAYVVTAGPAGAPFRDLVLQDFWFRTIDYWKHTSSMNNSQGSPNADGTTTYVISIKDPGVYNWLDTVGYHDLLVVHRWQGLTPDAKPWIKGQLVRLQDLEKALPPGMRRATPEQRASQLEERLDTFKLRYVDH